MHDHLKIAEEVMEEARVCRDEKLVFHVATAVDALIAYLKQRPTFAVSEETPFPVATAVPFVGPPPTVKDIADKLADLVALKENLHALADEIWQGFHERHEVQAELYRIVGVKDALAISNPAVEILRTLNSIHSLGDYVYDIREREGEGWDGPKVKAWGDACAEMQKLISKDDERRARAKPPEPVDNGLRPWPKDWPPFYLRNEPCDMKVGPCSCGA